MWACQWPSSQPLSSPQLSHNDSFWAEGISKSHREQGLGYREAEELSWCPSWSVTRMELWSGALSWWKCHWPDLKSAGLFPRNLFRNSLKTSTLNLTVWAINSGVLTSLLLRRLSSSLTDSLLSLNLLCHSKTDARFMQDAPKAVWSISYVSVAFLPNLKKNFTAYRSSKMSSRPYCIFELHQLWQSGFSRVYSNCCCSSSFES